MQYPYDITTEDYMKILESIGDHSENRVYARFVYIDRNSACEGWQINIDPSFVLNTVGNLKVRFEEKDKITRIHFYMSRQAHLDDRDLLLSTADKFMLDGNKPRANMDPWVLLYEWYTRQCLAIKINNIKIRKASCVIESTDLWLMDREVSVSERAMQKVGENVIKRFKD
jgi:hypothetical protein